MPVLEARRPGVRRTLCVQGEEQALRRRLEHLLQALDRLLDGSLEREADPGGRTVRVFGCIAYRVDLARRAVYVLVREDGAYVPQRYAIELFRPLSTHHWLVTLAFRLGLNDPRRQHLLFVPKDDRGMHMEWVAMAAWRCVRRDERFVRLRTRVREALALDPTLVTIGLAARTSSRGSTLSSTIYNTVWKHEPAFRQAARENPKLLPLVTAAFQAKRLGEGEGPVAGLARIFREAGLSRASWRYVAHHGSRLFRVAWQQQRARGALQVALEAMGRLESAGLPPPPPPGLLEAILAYRDAPGEIVAMVVRAARTAAGPEFGAEAEHVLQWAASEQPVLDKLQKRAGFPWALRQAQAWDKRCALDVPGPRRWHSALGESIRDDYRVVPLDTVEALIEEGMAMRNCLASRVDACQDGQDRYFSIREAASGKRLAVLGLTVGSGRGWRVADLKGPANRSVKELGVRLLASSVWLEYRKADPEPVVSGPQPDDDNRIAWEPRR